MKRHDIIIDAASISAANAALAKILVRDVFITHPDTVVLALLDGGFVFAADMMRELFACGIDPAFGTLRISSYGAAKESSGHPVMTASVNVPIDGKTILLLDDVLETGLSVKAARDILMAGGAVQIFTAVFARKPEPKSGRLCGCDFQAWDGPDRFLAGYGMDDKACGRGAPYIYAVD
ncbi:phosphoribosyltransferase [Robiginitomaculum antarcticum]|uniref:phosphoribosyltransferase n=1 Tax=Robiginitomaculum antarcticum TaxID=437507 RepID=UPI000382BDC5|nr:phosphoribosyltransferase family protein [Robiginitomaculum antarcticum]